MSNWTEITNALGKPAFELDDVLIYSGDCLDILKKIPKGSISLTVTSPPYNIGKEYEKVLPMDDYIQWTEDWTKLVHRATKSTGTFWLNLGYVSMQDRAKAIPLPYIIWNRINFFLIQEVVWNYGAGVAGKNFFSPRNEKFLWYVKNENSYTFNLDAVRDPNVKYPNQKKNGKLRCNPLGKNPSDVWQIPKVTSGKNRSSRERTEHPAQFPIELINRIILATSDRNEIVMDPFLGSGSTIEAAIRSGRKAIGFELNERYIEIAIERIIALKAEMSNENCQLDLLESVV